MANKQPDLHRPTCRCGTGDYCHRHKRYSRAKHLSSGQLGTDRGLDDYLLKMTQDEPCGGGRRVLRGGIS